MNLLIDQREQSDEQEPVWMPQSPEPPSSPLSTGPDVPSSAETPLDYYNFDESEGRRRGIVGPILIILFLLAAIVAAAYYGFFYKSQELGEFSPSSVKISQQTTPAVQVTPPAVTENLPAETAAIPREAPAEAALPIPGASSEPARSRPEALRGDSPLAKAAALLGGILAARPVEVQVSTLILDASSFSAEVSAGGRSAIESYSAALKSTVPGGLTSSPASGYYSGARALVTGNFPGINSTGQALIDEQGLARIKQTLRTAAKEAGLKVIEISQTKQIVRGAETWTPVFVKVSGSEAQFENYCVALAAQLPQMRLDKIILQKSVGVIRLEAQTR